MNKTLESICCLFCRCMPALCHSYRQTKFSIYSQCMAQRSFPFIWFVSLSHSLPISQPSPWLFASRMLANSYFQFIINTACVCVCIHNIWMLLDLCSYPIQYISRLVHNWLHIYGWHKWRSNWLVMVYIPNTSCAHIKYCVQKQNKGEKKNRSKNLIPLITLTRWANIIVPTTSDNDCMMMTTNEFHFVFNMVWSGMIWWYEINKIYFRNVKNPIGEKSMKSKSQELRISPIETQTDRRRESKRAREHKKEVAINL